MVDGQEKESNRLFNGSQNAKNAIVIFKPSKFYQGSQEFPNKWKPFRPTKFPREARMNLGSESSSGLQNYSPNINPKPPNIIETTVAETIAMLQ